ncbi:MAG: HD domain-containing protein [Coriobacteriales bacterium]|nr:HD domain-containing protein [Coriobacteriales bacterium]
MKYLSLTNDITQRIENDRADSTWHNECRTNDSASVRRRVDRDKATLLRPAFVRDADKILHSPYYNRLSDKTQVFSLFRNDDLTRRSLHVQLVSRIARTIGTALGLNTDLIEAIALGHDIGHPPFGHAGERFLNTLYHTYTGCTRFFDHNVHSVRVLDGIFRHNLSIQTLSGILCHNGEFEQREYRPGSLKDFAEFDALVERCYTHSVQTKELVPSTLEGCVVRISDMIAYVGKDRQDAERVTQGEQAPSFDMSKASTYNSKSINNFTVDLVENSYGKNYLQFSEEAFETLSRMKDENYRLIYDNEHVNRKNTDLLEPMFGRLYERLRNDLQADDKTSYIFKHHIDFVEFKRPTYLDLKPYREENHDQIVVDYIASMTDDYFVDLHAFLFPDEDAIKYVPYFTHDEAVSQGGKSI